MPKIMQIGPVIVKMWIIKCSSLIFVGHPVCCALCIQKVMKQENTSYHTSLLVSCGREISTVNGTF